MSMEKTEVVNILNKLKDSPLMVVFDEGTRMYSGLDDFYIFAGDKYLVQVCKNAGPYDNTMTQGFTQQDSAYKIMYGDYENISLIISFKCNTPKDVFDQLTGLTPVGTTKSLEDIKKLISADKLFINNKRISGYGDQETIVLNKPYSNMDSKTKKLIDDMIAKQT